jgi:phosphoesterase RecJ-like protein
MLTDNQISDFSELLGKDNICIVMHKSPDGDTIGSSFALFYALKHMEKNVELVCSDEIPEHFRFISDGQKDFDMLFEPDTVVSVDIASETLFGNKYGYLASRVDYAIDHHFSNTFYAKKTILSSSISSAGELIFELFSAANIEIDSYIAEKLYIAISFDSGCFRFSNTSPDTHRAAAELLKFGFDASSINVKLFDSTSLAQLKLESEVLNSVKQFKNNQISMVTVRYSQIERLGVNENELGGLTSITRRIAGTVVGITVREKSDGEIKISLRSQQESPLPDFDVSKVAGKFGGGGHIRAAGLSMRCSVEEAERKIIEAVLEEWERLYDNPGE